MAIFVSNPSTVSFTGVSTDPVDVALVLPEVGFTEELALAMRPRSSGNEAGPEGAERQADESDETLADLQILPPDVLLHAVGDANFALAAITPTVKPVVDESLTEVNPAQLPGAAALLVAAGPAALEVGSQVEPAAVGGAQTSLAMAMADVQNPHALTPAVGVLSEVNAPSVTDALPRGLANSPDSPVEFIAAQATGLAAEAAQGLQGSSSLGLSSTTSALEMGQLQALAAASGQPTIPAAPVQASVTTPNASDVATMAMEEVARQALSQEAALVADPSLGQDSARPVVVPTASLVDEVPAGVGQKLQPSADAINAREALALTAGEPSAGVRPSALPSDAVQTTGVSGGPVAPSVNNSAAKLSEATAQTQASATVAAQVMAPTQSQAEVQSASLAQNVTGVMTLPGGGSDAPNMASGRVTEKNAESALNFDAKLGTEPPAQVSAPVAAFIPEMVSARDQSLDELSATFVSSLVGGPQRPVTTVMDWIALQPQERPAPVEPHEVRLDGGAVQVEIQRLVKQGGGHIVMELTPPDQSKFTIELKLDDHGGAFLLVEGVSDSTRTRLEQSSSQLHEQFQQMGLNLQLDMRQHRESASSGSSERLDSEPGAGSQPKEVNLAESRAAASARAREAGSSQIYLYA